MKSLGTLKVTALVNLKEAIINQKYECCSQLISAAKKVGVAPSEIKIVIEKSCAKLKSNRLLSY